MFSGNLLTELVELFEERQVCLFHNAQFNDFQSYIKIGGIPSRHLLENETLAFTPFASDNNDQINSVWDKVFLNPLDFGEIFAFGNTGTPTVYGPIAFVMRPSVLLEAEDVAICLRSAGANGFNREGESLKSIHDVDRLFINTKDHGFPYSAQVKFTKSLRQEFNRDYVSNPEISCTYKLSKAPLSNLSFLLIDPYNINGTRLKNYVLDWLTTSELQIDIKERPCHSHRHCLYDEILKLLFDGIPSLNQIENSQSISPELKDWANELRLKNLSEQWLRFAQYFREGTLKPILAQNKA